MKKILLSLLVLCSLATSATTRYISNSGSNAAAGTIGAPWQTLAYAVTQVSFGDIIHINAGTYLQTATVNVPPGISLEGDGITSIITSTVGGATDANFTPTLQLVSNSATNGNQHISNLKFDGGMASSWAIWVGYRDSVSIYNCTIVDFYQFGVLYSNEDVLFITNTPPAHGYRFGNTFHDNIVNNCANYNGWGRGNLNIGGQQGMLVYNNTITTGSRASGRNGWPIKYTGDGFTRGLKIYNNILTKNVLFGAGEDWSFAMEIFNGTGTEIYGNTIQGSLDFNFQGNKDTYPWVLNIHDNTISIPSVGSRIQEGIIMEYSVDGMIIENNTFNNLSHVFCFFPRADAIIKNVYIRKNLVSNIGCTSTYPRAIFGFDAPRVQTSNFNLLNNTFSCDTVSGHNSDILMNFTGTGTFKFDSLIMKNNIFKGFFQYLYYIEDVTKFTNSQIKYNAIVPTGGGNNTATTPPWSPGTAGYPGTIIITNNLAGVEPRFTSAGVYTLQSSSPLIDAGTNVGLAYNGSAPDIGKYEYGAVTNTPPVANAGADQTITLPTSTVNLTGSATDAVGNVVSYAWTKQTGPTGQTITSPSTANTSVTGLVAGTYIFRLTATDDSSATGFDDVQIIVNPADVTPPILSSTSPTAGATGVSLSGAISCIFNEPLAPVTVNSGTAFISGVACSVSYTGGVIYITPSASLSPNTLYTVNITTAITDVAGNHYAGSTYTFTTGAAPVNTKVFSIKGL